ncbi:MAG TPA: twin-arginine translocase subunit TatC [Actinobacteria bacterium]|nr:twin-arginine translocase subunit TatC [Actinomycetota bacterium]
MADKKMSILDHLDELRKRIIVSVIAVIIGVGICFFYAYDILEILLKPAGDLELVFLGVLDPFMAKFKIAIFAGIFIALPVIIYQILSFLAPALKGHEKKIIYPMVLFFVILFACGAYFGYTYIMPVGTEWLLNQAEGQISPVLTIDKYVAYASLFIIAFGISFETPFFILILVMLGVVSPKSLRKNWRIAYLIILLFAAIVTPDWSPVTMTIFAMPMILLYELSILLAWGYKKLRKKKEDLSEGGVELDTTSEG